MAVTLENLYKPINDFFLAKFNTEEDNRISFRFDQFGTKIALEDFEAPRNPEEVFSDFVNRMPQMDDDGLNVQFSAKKIDQSYFYELLSPALPSFASELDEGDEEALTKNFSKLQHKAVADFEMLWQARSGVGDKFWVSYPTPLLWYNSQSTSFWENYDFQVAEKNVPQSSSPGLWKLKLNEAQLEKVVPHLTKSEDLELVRMNVKFSPVFLKAARMSTLGNSVKQPIGRFGKGVDLEATEKNQQVKPNVQLNFQHSFHKLNLTDKAAVTDLIKKHAPSKDVSANSISVHFQFAIVQIRRPWLFDIFLDNENWRIPGKQPGEISSAGNFTHLPVAFIVVRDLRITANWSTADKENSKVATNFGPFHLNGQINERGSIGYEGIQVIGWVLQQMASFPPR